MKKLALALLLAACGSNDVATNHGDGGNNNGNNDLSITRSDGGGGGDLAHHGTSFPIEHVIVIVKENHTFDNYFGSFPGAEGTTTAQTSTGTVQVGEPPTTLTRDLCHSHTCALTDWNSGAMNHWDLGDTKNQSDNLAFTQYTESDIPNYWQYARHFTLGDHFFSSMLGPSFPGHLFALAAQTGWATGNPSQLVPWGCDDNAGTTIPIEDQTSCTETTTFPCFKIPTVADLANNAGLSWKFYGSQLPPLIGEVWSMFDGVDGIRNGKQWSTNVVQESSFDADAAAGNLANIVWLVPQDTNSEHPPFNICSGENWTVGHINAVMQNAALWAKTVILFTYDDFGGWYDHVPPPKQYGCNSQQPYGVGFRLPFVAISPYAKPGHITRPAQGKVMQQASIPKFIEAIFGLPSLSSMDPAAQDGPDTDDLMDAFDWNQTPNPPLVLTTRNCLGAR